MNVTSRRWGRRPALGGIAGAAAAAVLGCGPASLYVRASPGRGPRATGEAPATVVVQWNEAALLAIRSTRPSPPVAARALAIAHTAMFDAWAVYDRVAVGTRLGSALRQPPEQHTPANRREAISYAAHRALADLFPGQVADFDAVLARLGYHAAPGPLETPEDRTPRGVGNAAAQAVLDFRRADGANQAGAYRDTTGYVPVNAADAVYDPNRWQPLRVPDGQGGARVQECAAPHWGLVHPFALTSGAQFRPRRGPRQHPAAAYRAQASELLRLSAGLTDRQKAVAEYWADGPATELPPGHWCLLTHFVSRRDGHDLNADVKLYFALTNALFDAAIAAWDAKRAFDYVRPITAIRFLFRGRHVRAWSGPYLGARLMDGGDWHPYQPATFVTPPFAEFVSGHSTFSAAAAEVLRRFTGSDAFGASAAIAAGSSRIEPGRTPTADLELTWDTFSAAADEAGLSRRFGAIHFEDGDLTGRALGRAVGAAVWAKASAHVDGTQ